MGLLPRPAEDRLRLQLMPGLPRGWKWDRQLEADILCRARCQEWPVGEVMYAELALDFELTAHRALPARPEHSLRMTVLPREGNRRAASDQGASAPHVGRRAFAS